jgi:hypothetical protein
MMFLTYLAIGFIAAVLYDHLIRKISKKDALIVSGYRLHHSLYGLAFLVLGVGMQSYKCIALGIGILIQHTITDGFRFLSKEK